MSQLWTATDSRLRLVLLVILAAIILPVGWYLGSPFFIDQMVNESFPGDAMSAKNQSADTMSNPSDPSAGTGPTAPRQAQATVLGTGQFVDIDRIHKGEGKATLFGLPDGQQALRLEDFEVTNGPDLYVYLSGHPAPRDSQQLHEGAAFEVARLKGNIGNQNYELPSDLDLSAFKSVVIYCKRFSVVFSTAELVTSS